jgi:hypothetical protein
MNTPNAAISQDQQSCLVEVGENRLVGSVTSEQLAGLIGLREPSLAASQAS